MRWAYGVTTVGTRLETTLPTTLASLEKAGFDDPFLFVDDADDVPDALKKYDYTTYCPALRTMGNWMVAAWSLYVRNRYADRFAIFQDDFITYRNLREYLERTTDNKKAYWNCYTWPENEKGKGWHLSNQRGLGAVALVFNADGFRGLLGHQHMADRVQDEKKGHIGIDGGIVDTFKKMNGFEFVHSPSLTQHIGEQSSMGNGAQQRAVSFYGEDFNALELLKR